jgi:hypothetical protein
MAKDKITLINIVQQFPSDKDSTTEQKVTIDLTDPEGPWAIISHNGNYLSLSINNWEQLKNLFEKAEEQLNLKQ